MGFPEIAWLVSAAFTIITSIVDEGETKSKDMLRSIPHTLLLLAVFAYGGFFNTIGAPQIIYFVLLGIAFIPSLIVNGRYFEHEEKPVMTVVSAMLFAGLLYWGGFFG